MNIFSLENVTLAFPTENGQKIILEDVHFALKKNEKVAIFAPNGSGKTSLLRAITGLDPLYKGSLFFHDTLVTSEEDFRRLRRSVGFAVQDARDQIFFPNVLEDVVFGPLNIGLSSKEAEERAIDSLRSLGIESLKNSQTHKLSGGELRLVALAGIIALKPEALLLDEPTTALDEASEKRLEGILQQTKTAYVVVSHDLSFIRAVSQIIYTIREKHLIRLE